MDNLNDNALMLKVKAGDIDKMALLFERYCQPLYGFFLHMTKQKEASEDMVQNVFFRMLKYRNTFSGTGEFKTWMYHIARNILNDHHKQIKKQGVPYDLTGMYGHFEEEELANKPLEKKQELKTLQAAINGLGEEHREILVLCRFQNLKYKEIASLLKISEGAVKVRMHRALNELKNNYSKIAR